MKNWFNIIISIIMKNWFNIIISIIEFIIHNHNNKAVKYIKSISKKKISADILMKNKNLHIFNKMKF